MPDYLKQLEDARLDQECRMERERLLALVAASARRVDENGFLHVLDNPVSKAQVARYFGAEIPGWQELSLDPEAAYMMLRPADELEKAAPSINRLPIELWHNDTDAENLPKMQIIGSMGSDGRFDGTYLRNSLCFTDGGIIRLITSPEAGEEPLRELSLSYFYDPDMTPGEWNGTPYDGVMRNIRGNHLALVDKGRAGRDVAVRDRDSMTGLNQDGGPCPPNTPQSATGKARQRPNKESFMSKVVKISAALGGRILSSLRKGRLARDADPENAASIEAELVKELTDGNVLEAVEEAVEQAVTDENAPAADNDKGQIIAAIMELVGKGSLDDAGKTALADLLAKLAAAPAADSPGGGANPEQASDEKAEGAPAADEGEKNEKDEKSMSAEEVKKTAEDAAVNSVLPRLQAVMDAQRDVLPIMGEVRVNLARDRAEDIYGVALDHMGISRAGMPRTAYRHVFLTARDAMNDGRGMVKPARDAAPDSAKADFEHLKNLRARRG